MTNNEVEGLGDPVEPPAATSSFPRPAPPSSAPPPADRPDETLPEQVVDMLVFVELSSLILLFSAVAVISPYGGAPLVWYAFSVGLVSFASCLGIRLADHFRPGSLDGVIALNSDPALRRVVTVRELVATFLFFWWGFGACFLTFRGPFTVTSNGYFASWGGLLATALWYRPSASSFDGARRGAEGLDGRSRALAGLLSCSVVLLLASVTYVRIPTGAWGLSCGAVTAAAAMALLAVEREKMHSYLRLAVAVVLVIMWICAAGVLTFKGPFVFTGNGYFASWIGLVCCVWYATYDARR